MRPGANVAPSHVEEAIPVDLVDPHRAALEYNPEHAETPSLSTILAVIVSARRGRREQRDFLLFPPVLFASFGFVEYRIRPTG